MRAGIALTRALALTALLIAAAIPQAWANESSVKVSVEKDLIEFRSIIALKQNVTPIGELEAPISGGALLALNRSLSKALQERAPRAAIRNLEARLVASKGWFNITLKFNVEGVTKVRGNKMFIDCAWKNFWVKEDLEANGVKFNKVGEAYLGPAIEKYENASGVRFWLNKTHSVAPEEAIAAVKKLSMLDFREFSAPLDGWNKTYSIAERRTFFRYDAPPKLDFNLTLMGAANKSVAYLARVDSEAEISAPNYAKAEGDVITVNLGEGRGPVPLISILIAAAIVTYVYERRIKKRKV